MAVKLDRWEGAEERSRDEAFAELYESSYPSLVKYCRGLLGNSADPEEVAQEAFLRAWMTWDRYSTNRPSWALFATIARTAILGFTALIALEQLHIAPALLNELFAGIVGAAALAFGLAFGLGGRETAQHMLNRAESRVSDASLDLSTQQRMNQPTDVPEVSAEQRPRQQSPTQFRRTS